MKMKIIPALKILERQAEDLFQELKFISNVDSAHDEMHVLLGEIAIDMIAIKRKIKEAHVLADMVVAAYW